MSQPNILWGLTASVAAIRAGDLAAALQAVGNVKAVATQKTRHFLSDFPSAVPLFTDDDEWEAWKGLGDPVLHIELRRWADVLVVAPASADCLAKLAAGVCDNLLYSVVRAWDFSKPVVIAPAMNTYMWEHPSTARQLATLESWGVRFVNPVEKQLACADVGMGALAPADAIAAVVGDAWAA